MLGARLPGHQAKIRDLYRRTAVGHRDVSRLEIKDRLVLLVVNYEIDGDFVGVRNNGGFISLGRGCRCRLGVTLGDEEHEGQQR